MIWLFSKLSAIFDHQKLCIKSTSSERSDGNVHPGCLTFKGVLIHDEQTVNLYLLAKGGLVGGSAAGEELAGADAAGESLEGCPFMRQDGRRGRNKEKPNKAKV